MVVDNVKGVILLTYNLCDDITMVLVNVDDGILTANPLLIFYRDKKEIPISDIIPSITGIEITEDLRNGGYILSLTDTAGTTISMPFPELEFIAFYLQVFVTDCVARKTARVS